MEQHKQLQMYVGFEEGGCQDVATVKLEGFVLVDASKLKALMAERDALAAQVEVLTPLARRCLWGAIVWNDHNFDPLHTYCRESTAEAGVHTVDQANALLESTPTQCLAEIKAQAVEDFAKALSNSVQVPNGPITRVDYYKAAIRHTIQFASNYAESIRKGEV